MVTEDLKKTWVFQAEGTEVQRPVAEACLGAQGAVRSLWQGGMSRESSR